MHGLAETVTEVMRQAESSRPPENTTDSKRELTPEQREERRREYVKSVGDDILWFSKCSVPKRYYGKTLKTFNGFSQQVADAMEVMQGGGSIFLSGPCGTGKSHLAVALMIEWMRFSIKFIPENARPWITVPSLSISPAYVSENKFPLFLPSVEFFLSLKNTFGNNERNEDHVIREYMKAPLLIIDDVGAEKVSDWSRQMFYTLIDRCYRSMKPVIITSNMDLTKIAETFDDRIASRIVGMGSVITLAGEDYRMKKP